MSDLGIRREANRNLERENRDEYDALRTFDSTGDATGLAAARPHTYRAICAHLLIEKKANVTPNTLAVVDRVSRLSYCALNEAANRVANYLNTMGVGMHARVGLCLDRSADAIVAVLGILKAGASYVPLERGYPAARLVAMINDAGLVLIITDSQCQSCLPPSTCQTLLLDGAASDIRRQQSANLQSVVTLASEAYIGYTSGSSGDPKGVVHTHRHLVHRIPDINAGDVCSMNVSLSFAFSLVRLFPPLFCGATLVIVQDSEVKDVEAFSLLVEREAITNIALVPSLLSQLVLAN